MVSNRNNIEQSWANRQRVVFFSLRRSPPDFFRILRALSQISNTMGEKRRVWLAGPPTTIHLVKATIPISISMLKSSINWSLARYFRRDNFKNDFWKIIKFSQMTILPHKPEGRVGRIFRSWESKINYSAIKYSPQRASSKLIPKHFWFPVYRESTEHYFGRLRRDQLRLASSTILASAAATFDWRKMHVRGEKKMGGEPSIRNWGRREGFRKGDGEEG